METIIIIFQAVVILGLLAWVLLSARTNRREIAALEDTTAKRIKALREAVAARDETINTFLKG